MARPIYSAKYLNSWAVVVGINAYEHVSPLKYARNDAAAFAEQLTARFGFPKHNVTVLLDNDATLRQIQSAIHSLVRTTHEDDRVIVFYAGHGLTVPAAGREAGFLVPSDGKAYDTSTLLPWDDLVSTSRMVRAKHMLFVMDACYGGLIGTRGLVPGAKRFLRDMLGRYSRQFLTAGKADEVVADSGGPRNGHSVFTGHLLDALDGGLQAPDGLVSANALMAFVYDRVSKDHHSRQAPHYGFLAGDGDFFFASPAVEADSDTPEPTPEILVEVPPDLIPQDQGEKDAVVTLPLLDQVKDYLSDHRHRIRLHDLVMRELRACQQRLGEESFSVQSGTISNEEFATRLLKYEAAMGDLLRVSVLFGRWAEADQQNVVGQIVNVLAGQIESKGGYTLWLALRSFPMLLSMYAGGIAALDGGNYLSLKTLLSTPVRSGRQDATATAVQATTQAMLQVAQTDAFKMLPGHERNYAPQSEYLFKRMQPILEDILFLGTRYEDLFDRFEVFYALTNADYEDDYWGYPGRFAWKYRHGGSSNPFNAILEEAKRERDNWAPLRAGLFRGSHARFAEVAEKFRAELLNKLNWH